MTRAELLFGLITYEVVLGLALSFINFSIPITYSSTSQTLTTNGYGFYLIDNISILPLWFNIIFLALPIAFIITLIVWSFFPTTNAGA